jgi:hypothetical protein
MYAPRVVRTGRSILVGNEHGSGTKVGTMIRAAVALLLSFSLLGCFPHNPKARTYAKIGEGTAIVAGIIVSALANTTADCDQMMIPGVPENTDCESGSKWASTAGVILVVGGLLGFVATVSTAEDPPKPKAVDVPAPTQAQAPAAAPAPEQGSATEPAANPAEPSAQGSAAPQP